MKKILIAVMFLTFLIGCKKEIITYTIPIPVNIVGVLYIEPIGLQTDSFRYKIEAINHPVNAFIPIRYFSGIVSTSSIIYKLCENSTYKITYKNNFGVVQIINHSTSDTLINFTDSLPATIY